MKDFTIATVSSGIPTTWYNLQKEFYKSLDSHEVVTINYTDEVWDGFNKKPKWLYRAIKEKLINTKYLIFTDSWDVVWAATPQEVIDRYLSFATDIVINAERNCFPGHFKESFDAKCLAPTEYKYLNSGFIVGKTDAILACLEAMDLPSMLGDHFDQEKNCVINPEDQSKWAEMYLKQPASIALDYHCALSQTMHEANMDEFDFSEARIRNKVTNSHPCVWHMNGSSKDKLHIRNPILTHLKLA